MTGETLLAVARTSTRRRLLLAAALSVAACGGGGARERSAPPPTAPSAAADSPARSTEPERAATPQPAETPQHAETSQLAETPQHAEILPPPAPPDPAALTARAGLGREIVALIETATLVEVGQLQTGGVWRAEQQTLRALTHIAGYRVRGRLKTLSAEQARELTTQVLEDESYDPSVMRCANTSWLGVRFTAGANVVELAIGEPCEQAVWAANPSGTVVRWGARMTPSAVAAVQSIVDAP